MLARVVLALLRVVDRVLQRLLPPRPDQVAWLSDPDYIGNAFHLFRHVVTTRRDLRHVWLVTDDAVRARIEADVAAWGGYDRGHRVQVIDRHSVRGYLAYLRSRWVFHTHGVYRWVGSAVGRDCVSLWHGMPIKAIGALNTRSPNPHPTFGTLQVATSASYRDVIARAFETPPSAVLTTALPRCDVLHAPSPVGPGAQAVRSALGLPADGPLVLWLPTYRTPGHRRGALPGLVGFRTFLDDLADAQWRAVDEEARRVGATVVLKPHPTDPIDDVGEQALRDLGVRDVRLVTARDWLATGLELYDVLAHVDGLLTDVSSVLVDWLETARPLGLLGFDRDTYTRDVVVDVDAIWSSPRVDVLDDPDAVAAFFTAVAEGRSSPADAELAAWLCPERPGTGCETVLAAVGLAGDEEVAR